MSGKERKTGAYWVFSRIVADMSSPIVLSAFFFAFVCMRVIPDPIRMLKVYAVCLATFSVLPLFYILAAYMLKLIPDIHLYKKEERNKVFPAIAVFYLSGLLVLYKISAPSIIIGLAFATTAIILMIWWINTFYKISIHMSGIGGMIVGLFFVFGVRAATPFVPFLPLAAWVRYKSGAHTLPELAFGAMTGISVTWFVLTFLFN